jgi:hypothetical protein
MPGVFSGEEGDADELPGVDAPDVVIIPEPTGVDMDGFEAEPSQQETVFDSAAFFTAVEGGLEDKLLKQIRLHLLRWGWWLATLR